MVALVVLRGLRSVLGVQPARGSGRQGLRALMESPAMAATAEPVAPPSVHRALQLRAEPAEPVAMPSQAPLVRAVWVAQPHARRHRAAQSVVPAEPVDHARLVRPEMAEPADLRRPREALHLQLVAQVVMAAPEVPAMVATVARAETPQSTVTLSQQQQVVWAAMAAAHRAVPPVQVVSPRQSEAEPEPTEARGQRPDRYLPSAR